MTKDIKMINRNLSKQQINNIEMHEAWHRFYQIKNYCMINPQIKKN